MIRFLALLFVFGAFAQPPIQSYDQQIQRSDFFAEEYPNYPVCKIENLTMIDDVSDGTVGQCLKKLTSTTWGGGQCGTGGGTGVDYDASQADQQHAWKFAVQQLPLTASINFVTGACPSGWGTNCWSAEPRAIVGSYVGVNGGSPPSDVVLISNTRIAYASASNKRASSVWLGNTQYKVDFIAHNGLLGTRQVVYSTLSTQLPGTNWQNLRLEFSDGTFAPATTGTAVNRTTDKANLIQYLNLQAFNPSQSNLYPAIKDIIKAGSNVTLSPSDSNNTLTIGSTGGGGGGSGSSVLTAYDSPPPDLSSFVNNQILPVNSTTAPWLRVTGSNIQHGFKINGAVDPNNANNYGASYTGDMYGSLSTEEGGQPLNASSSCIERFEVQMNSGGDDTLTVLIKKTCLPTAPPTIYYRIYQKAVGTAGDELATGSLTKGPDNTAHSYHTYLSPSGDGTANLLWSDKENVKYVRFFSSNPATDDETSNPLNIHPSKTTTVFDIPPAEWAREGQPQPIGAVPSQRFTVQRTQRIVSIGNYRLVDKGSNIANIPQTSFFYTRFATLSDGSKFNVASAVNSISTASLSNVKFYRIAFNSDNTDYTYNEVTLAPGVSLPTDFPIWFEGSDIKETHDDKVLLIGGYSSTTSSAADNHKIFVLDVDHDNNQIRSIRTLNSTIRLSIFPNQTDKYRSFGIYKKSSGDFFILNSTSSNNNSNRTFIRFTLQQLTILENSDTILTKINDVHTSQGGNKRLLNSSYAESRGDLIEKTNYSYIVIRAIEGAQGSSANYYRLIRIRNSDSQVDWAINTSFSDSPNANNLHWINNYFSIRLLDGSFFWNGYRYSALDIVDDGQSDTISDTKQYFPDTALARTQLATFPQYRNDYVTPALSNYNALSFVLNNGVFGSFLMRRIYGNTSQTQGFKLTAIAYFPVTGDVQTVISRRLLDSATFDTANAVYIRDELGMLTGANRLSGTKLSDINVLRLTELPAESSSLDGEQCYITANYTKDNGINITPQLFAGTELDSVTNSDAPSGIGTQGWYRKADAGFTFGEINPDLPSDFVLISDKRVYVKDNTQTNLSKLYLGTTEYTLTRVNQTTTKLFSTPGPSGPNNPLVDYYTIGGTGLPASGDWDDLRFETTTAGTFVPATTTIPKGLYENRNSDWVRGGFDAPEVQSDKDFKIAVEEQRPGTRADKNLPFTASGSTFTTTTPFPGILRITYNNLSTDTDTYQRYTVFVPLEGFQDSKAPHLLKIGSVNYSLAYFETDAGQGVYRSAVVKSTERITSASTRNAMNVQALDNSWFGETGAGKFLKTITKHDLSTYANAIQEVHALPGSPHEGQRIQLLNDLTVPGGAVMTAAESSGTDSRGTSISGLFVGFETDAKYDNGSVGGDLGSLDPTNTNFAGLLSFSNARSAGSEANKTFFVSPNGNTYAPTRVWINGVRYAVGSAVNRDFFPLTGLDGSFIKAGKKYYVNVENSSGTKLFADQNYKQGDELIWDGIHWIKALKGLSQDEVDARVNSLVPKQFRNDADTTGQKFQPTCFWSGSEANYTSATKEAGCIYFRGP